MAELICRLCSGTATVKVAGHDQAPTLRAFAPTDHGPGDYGDLYRCLDCGAVQQPALPSGEDLHQLYREMEDPAYLDEEQGRRATAERLLDLIRSYVPAGRL